MMNLSVVIVEYMDIEMLKKAVLSITTHIPELSGEIIVVSNSSYPQAKQSKIRATLPQAHFIFNKDNLGFAKAVNQGIRKSSGEFIMLLNPDAKLLDKSLLQAIDFMFENPQVAVVGPMILDHDRKLQDSCRNFMNPFILIKRTFRRVFGLDSGPVLERRDYSKAQQVDWVSGACLIARRAAISGTGLMDERYFMYAEDMDWCRRFWQNGWEVWYYPDWQIEHDAGRGSSSKVNLINKLMWIHLISLCKYYLKWVNLDNS